MLLQENVMTHFQDKSSKTKILLASDLNLHHIKNIVNLK